MFIIVSYKSDIGENTITRIYFRYIVCYMYNNISSIRIIIVIIMYGDLPTHFHRTSA